MPAVSMSASLGITTHLSHFDSLRTALVAASLCPSDATMFIQLSAISNNIPVRIGFLPSAIAANGRAFFSMPFKVD